MARTPTRAAAVPAGPPRAALMVVTLLVAALPAGCTPDRSAPPPRSAPGSYQAGRSTPVADPVYPRYGNPSLDVLHYQLQLAWSPARQQLTGTATLAVRVARPVTELILDFAHRLAVDEVRLGASADQLAPVTATRRGDDLVVPARRQLAADTRLILVVRYHGRPAPVPMPSTRADAPNTGFVITRNGGAWTMQEPYGAFTWYPVNDQPSDEALYDVDVTVPDGWSGVSNGTLTGVTRTAGEATYRWHSDDPIASYLVTFAVDRFRRVNDTGPHGLPISYWVRADHTDILDVLRRTPELIGWLEKRFGRYPFRSAGVVIVPSPSGMETQTMITLGGPSGRMSADARAAYDEVLLHELAHQWFGDAVTPRSWTDLWLNEGFAMYAQVLYAADAGHLKLADELAEWRDRDAKLRRDYGPPGHYRPDRFATSNVYLCPALMLDQLRHKLGDEKFFATIRAWVSEHRNTQQDRASFVRWLNRYTGEDFTDLVNRWLDSPTTPE